MGVIADFIVANESEAVKYSLNQTGIASSDLLEATGITRVELSTLLAFLNGKKWHEDLLDLFPPVGDSSDLIKVADQLLDRLTNFDYDFDQLAAEWAATEEMQWDLEEARMLIEDLAQHAVRARRSGKSVYLWNCG